MRAGIGGTTTWVPRVNRQRDILCGFQPTLGPVTEPDAPAEPATQVAAAPEATPAPQAPAPTAAAVTTRSTTPPPAEFTPPRTIITSAATATTPTATATPSSPPATGPRSPVITRIAGTSTIAAPPLTRSGDAPRAEPARLTRSQFCEGKTGPQPGFINSRTGETIDCGPATSAGAAVTQAAASSPALAATPAVEAPAIRRASRTEICAEMRETGQQYLNAATGLPVRCPMDPAAVQVAQGAISVPATTQVASTACSNFTGISAQYVPNTPGVRCGPQAQNPVTGSVASVAAPATPTTRVSTKRLNNPFNPPVPASNPSYVREPDPQPPHGFEHVWTDGRLNPYRGLQTPVAGTTTRLSAPAPQPSSDATSGATAALTEPRVSTRTVAPQSVTAPANPYVEVGTFTNRDQAQNIAKALRSRGLPMRIAVYDRAGQEYRIVLAGPFASQSAVDSALGQVRGAGFGAARPARY